MDRLTLLKDTIYERFFDAITNNSLQKLVDTAYELLGYPVLINDDMGYNIVYAPAQPIGDADFDELQKTKNSTSEHFMLFYRKYISDCENQEYPILICDGDKSKSTQLFSVLRFHGAILGYTSFIIQSEHIDNLKDVVQLFNVAARSIIVAQKEKQHMREQRSNHILNYLLTAPDVELNDYKKNAQNLAVRYKAPYILLRVKCQEEGVEDAFSSGLFTIMRKRIPNLLHTDLDKSIYFLISNYEEKDLADTLKELELTIGRYPVHISTSLPFENLEEAQGYYQQTALTMDVGLRVAASQFLYKASDYLPLQLYACFEEKNMITPYLNPKILQIMEYDKINKTEYFNTLRVYLYCFLNMKDAAEMLHIHVNTMHYRVNRLEEMFQINFKDYGLLNILVSNMGLLSISKKIHPEVFLQTICEKIQTES